MCGRSGPGRFSPTTVLAALTLMVLAVGLLVTAADAAGPGNSANDAQALCQSYGGTFGVGGFDFTGGITWREIRWVCID